MSIKSHVMFNSRRMEQVGGGKILKPEWMSVGNKRCKIGSLLLLCSSPIGIKGLVSRLRKAVGVALEK